MTDASADRPDAAAGDGITGPLIELRYESRMSEQLTMVAWALRRSDLAFGIGVAGIVAGVAVFAAGDRMTAGSRCCSACRWSPACSGSRSSGWRSADSRG